MRSTDTLIEGFGGLKIDPYTTLGDGFGGCASDGLVGGIERGDGGSEGIQPDGGTRV